jgi:hypothetical protein
MTCQPLQLAPGRRFGPLAAVERVHRSLSLSGLHSPWSAVRADTSCSPVSAWKLAARERFIGWRDDECQRNLQLVVNNARFLILP